MKKLKKQLKKFFPLCLKDWLVFFVTMGLTSVVCQTLKGVSDSDVHVPMIFVLAVLIVSLLTDGYFYGTLAALVSVLGVNWAFTYPYFKLDFSIYGYPLTFMTIAICVAYVILAGINNAPLKPAVLVIVAACGIFIILRGLLDASKIRKRALYAITDKRLLILTDSAKSVEYSAISAAKLDRDEDGHTSLLCGEDAIKAKPWKRRAAMLSGAITDDNTGMCERFVMYALPDADKVKETLKPFLPL